MANRGRVPLALRVPQHPDLLAAVDGWSAPEVAVVGNDLEAGQLKDEPHLVPQRPAQGEPLRIGPKDTARFIDLAGRPVFDDELTRRIGAPGRELPGDAVPGAWMNDLSVARLRDRKSVV